MQNYIELKQCRVCSSKKLVEVLDLNNQPLANSYHDNDSEQEEYPLKIHVKNIQGAAKKYWTLLVMMVPNLINFYL